ncbi:hypothetical protein VP1G_00439 [Cytospora mali]|uniref:Uncharacterized protein n=1 Tax=Cytospora mali TaxID=578113 RepID=A0A194UN62_CYTMA|nr:hypothetical protein VP1G_00439 [Valsa mali var. pyri (nom. inval.)]
MTSPTDNSEEPPRSYHHRKRHRLPSSSTVLASPQKRHRTPLGELGESATNKLRPSVRSPDTPACKDFGDAIEPLAGVPAWVLEDCLKSEHPNSGGPRACVENVDTVAEVVRKEGASSDSVSVNDVTVVGDLAPFEDVSEVDYESYHQEATVDVSADEMDDVDLATRLQALPAHTLRSIIYDIAVTDNNGGFKAKLTEADAAQDVPSAIFGYQYCSVDSIVTNMGPESSQYEVEDARYRIEELLIDITGQIYNDSPYSMKRAALVVILKTFEVIFGFQGEGNCIAEETPADVEVNWASLFKEVFGTLTMFEKQRLATAKYGVFLKKLDNTASSIAMAGLGCSGQQQGVLAELTRVSVQLSQHGESARSLEELERAIKID